MHVASSHSYSVSLIQFRDIGMGRSTDALVDVGVACRGLADFVVDVFCATWMDSYKPTNSRTNAGRHYFIFFP